MNNFSSNLKYVGYNDIDDIAKNLFDSDTIKKISQRISLIFQENYQLNIVVTDKVIIGVLNQYFENYVPYQNGDIYTKDTQSKFFVNELENLVEQTIYFIVSTISMERMQDYKNSQLNVWNDTRSKWFDNIKVQHKKPNNFSWIPAGQLGNNVPQMN